METGYVVVYDGVFGPYGAVRCSKRTLEESSTIALCFALSSLVMGAVGISLEFMPEKVSAESVAIATELSKRHDVPFQYKGLRAKKLVADVLGR